MRRHLQAGVMTGALILSGVFGASLPAYAGCVTPDQTDAAMAVAAGDTSVDITNWELKRVCNATAAAHCIPTSGGDPQVMCCDPTTTGLPVNQACPVATPVDTGATAGSDNSSSAGSSSWIPSDIRACMRTGSCNPDHIVRLGAAFANYLFGLSGAIFLLTFVYGGFLYLTAGGASENVKKAQKMLTEATIGMMLMFGASTLIRFVYNSVMPPSRCQTERADQGYACQYVEGDTPQARQTNGPGCLTGLCNLPDQGPNIMCCPTASDPGSAPVPSDGTASDSPTAAPPAAPAAPTTP